MRGTYRLVETGGSGGDKWYLFEIPGVPFSRFIAYASWFWFGWDPLWP